LFRKLLIANRGEIACRVMRTARRLGVRAVAVYSEADRRAMHVALADEAVLIGPPAARESYLNGPRIVEAARQTGAEAIHPGYGFLSENAEFAELCAQAGLVFIGPPAAAILAMGDKAAAKALMQQAGVPVVPGYHGDAQDEDLLAERAAEIGYPVLIKAVAGGGGRGMRRVDGPEQFAAALKGARREAASAFGDDRVLVERYLGKPRHIELQVFADMHGGAVHLFERDCSVQRRHQKVLEEAPAPGMTAEMRDTMGAAAVQAARAIGYVGAGTIEFIADVTHGLRPDAFFFMEMNTRLQVEHPVTEMITGQDLVEWQLRIACGERLPLTQEQLTINGHAVEARVYAEDPARNFLPSTGLLQRLKLPAEGPHLRIDTGVRQGDEVSVHYDPMIAKVIAWDHDRGAALRRLAGALESLEIAGPTANVRFLAAVAQHPAFVGGDLDTGFIERHRKDLIPPRGPVPVRVLALAVLDRLLMRRREAKAAAASSSDPFSPWAGVNGWRLNDAGEDRLTFRDGERDVVACVGYLADGGFRLTIEGYVILARGELEADGDLSADLDGLRLTAAVVPHGPDLVVFDAGRGYRLGRVDPLALPGLDEVGEGSVRAPLPGKVAQLLVSAPMKVKKGQPLLVVEAMKMEHTIAAPADGTVTALRYAAGDAVEEGAELVGFEPAEP